MDFTNLKIKKVIKNTTIALLTGTMLSTTPIGTLTKKVEAAASNYTVNNRAMTYFIDDVNENIQRYLDENLSSSNLSTLLGYYDKLYDFIYNGTKVRDTYYVNLAYYEQEELKDMLLSWGNEIYDAYRSTSYFKTTSTIYALCNR